MTYCKYELQIDLRKCVGHNNVGNGWETPTESGYKSIRFSYSHSQVDAVVKYVLNQEDHHRSKSFKVEYFEFLKKFAISFDEKYLFDFIEK